MIATVFAAQAAYADGFAAGLTNGFVRSDQFPDLAFARSGHWWTGYADGLHEGFAMAESTRPATARRVREAYLVRLEHWQRVRDTAGVHA